MRLVDLSHVVEHGITTYPGLPGPVIDEYMSFEASADHYVPGTEFAIGRIALTQTFRDGIAQ